MCRKLGDIDLKRPLLTELLLKTMKYTSRTSRCTQVRQEFIDMFLLKRSVMFQRCSFAWNNDKCSGFRLVSFTERSIPKLIKYYGTLFPSSDICLLGEMVDTFEWH